MEIIDSCTIHLWKPHDKIYWQVSQCTVLEGLYILDVSVVSDMYYEIELVYN
jgi:hypothetical protein